MYIWISNTFPYTDSPHFPVLIYQASNTPGLVIEVSKNMPHTVTVMGIPSLDGVYSKTLPHPLHFPLIKKGVAKLTFVLLGNFFIPDKECTYLIGQCHL